MIHSSYKVALMTLQISYSSGAAVGNASSGALGGTVGWGTSFDAVKIPLFIRIFQLHRNEARNVALIGEQTVQLTFLSNIHSFCCLFRKIEAAATFGVI